MASSRREMTVPVEVVRPYTGWGNALARAAAFFLRVWLLMLAVGAVLPQAHLGYWTSALVLVGLDAVFQQDYGFWTRAAGRVKK